MSEAYYSRLEKQGELDATTHAKRMIGHQLRDTDYPRILEVFVDAGFTMDDQEPRGRGYGYWGEIMPADVDVLLLALKKLDPEVRRRIAAVFSP